MYLGLDLGTSGLKAVKSVGWLKANATKRVFPN